LQSGLPQYICFDEMIRLVRQELNGKKLSDFYNKKKKPSDYDGVNYTILNNKTRYTWRPIELIHPALYVSLVHLLVSENGWRRIQRRFKTFSRNPKICCLSLPIESASQQSDKAAQITHWLEKVEQRSIELSLEYQYIFATDITDCYGSIYTHSIAWALHGKQFIKDSLKDKKNKLLLGNQIDKHIQGMRHGQTNGIPQGSVLMDFIAEMVLGFADLELSKKIEAEQIGDYQILRYRDDYRIFVNNPQDGERILICLTEVMIDLGLKLNATKTKSSSAVIRASIKPDKLEWLFRKQPDKITQTNPQKHLLMIHDHALQFPNSGSLLRALDDFRKKKEEKEEWQRQFLINPVPLIAIVVDIAYHNPRAYPHCAAILSWLLKWLTDDEKQATVEKIKKRFDLVANTGYLQIWLQRVIHPFDQTFLYEEKICHLVAGEQKNLWNSEWVICEKLRNIIDDPSIIIDQDILEKLPPEIANEEIALFTYSY